jgi:hypothetical protein
VFAAKGGQSALNRWLAQSDQKVKAVAALLTP